MDYKNCLIVIPMKSLGASKSRLEKHLPKNIKDKIVLNSFFNTYQKIKMLLNIWMVALI